jgi:hypothetical protein
VLNIFTEHNLQDAIRKWRKPWKLWIREGDGGQLAQI